MQRAIAVEKEEDRRVVSLSLTRKGQATFQKLESAVGARMKYFMAMLDTADRESLISILDKLAARAAAQVTVPRRAHASR